MEDRAVDVAAFLRAKECDGRGDILGRAEFRARVHVLEDVAAGVDDELLQRTVFAYSVATPLLKVSM